MLPEKTSIDKFFWTLFGGNDHIVAGDRFETQPKLMGNIVEEASQYAFQLYTVNPIHPSIDFAYGYDPKKYESFDPKQYESYDPKQYNPIVLEAWPTE